MNVVKLGEISNFIMGQAPPGSACNTEGVGTPFVKAGEFGVVRPIIREWTTEPLKLAERSDVLICVVGATAGKLNLGECCAIGRSVAAIRPDQNKLDQFYLYNYLQTWVHRLRVGSQGSAQGVITKPMLGDLVIPLPPLADQKRIAAILDKADAIRRKRQAAIKLADKFLRATFLDLFDDPVTNPKGWKESRLCEIADIRSGITKGRKLNGHEIVNVPYMRVANVQDGHISLAEIKTIEATHAEIDRYLLRQGDILLTEGGDPDKLGRGAVWQGEIKQCIHQNHIFRVRPNPSYSLPDYLSALIGSARGKQYFLVAAKQTTGIASINMTQLNSFPVLLPPIILQKRFSEIVQKQGALRQKLSAVNYQQNNCFNSLTQRAFRGEL